MKYTILIEKPAEKFIVKLPKPEKEQILEAIRWSIVYSITFLEKNL